MDTILENVFMSTFLFFLLLLFYTLFDIKIKRNIARESGRPVIGVNAIIGYDITLHSR